MTAPIAPVRERRTSWWIVGIVAAALAGAAGGAGVAWAVQQDRIDAAQAEVFDQEVAVSDLDGRVQELSEQLAGCQSAISGAAGALAPAYDHLDDMTGSVENFFTSWDYRAGDAVALSAGVFDGATGVRGTLSDAVNSLVECDMTAP